jgi:outer membrane receptor protein involved in Fe transport
MISLSGFYKTVDKPIELLQDPTANNTEIVMGNSKSATISGIELETIKKMDFINALRHFAIGGNFTLVNSIVDIPDSIVETRRATDPTAKNTRPLQGQAPYILNVFLSYENKDKKIGSNLNYNISGQKLFLVTKPNGATPYVYEEPFPALNYNISKGIGNFTVEFSIKNIVNSVYSTIYDYKDVEEDINLLRYSIGRTYGFSLTYLID